MRHLALMTLFCLAATASAIEGGPGLSVAIVKGNELLKAGAYEEAYGVISDALALEAGSVRLLRLRANTAFAMGKYDQALDDLTEVVELVPDSAKAYFDRAVVFTALGNEEEAFLDVEKALNLQPDLTTFLEEDGETINGKVRNLIIRAKAAKNQAVGQIDSRRGIILPRKGGQKHPGKKWGG